MGELAAVVARHRDVVRVVDVVGRPPLGDRLLERLVGVVVLLELEQRVALARERLDPVGERQVVAREDLIESLVRLGELLVVGLERRDVEVAVDRLARLGVRLHSSRKVAIVCGRSPWPS